VAIDARTTPWCLKLVLIRRGGRDSAPLDRRVNLSADKHIPFLNPVETIP
jgi:hypothetical protein